MGGHFQGADKESYQTHQASQYGMRRGDMAGQGRLSEIIGVGPSHMSHIESGSTVPSLEVFISILNALDCSADELLCRETNAGKPLLNSWLSEIIADCDPTETKILSDIVISAKETLRRNKISE